MSNVLTKATLLVLNRNWQAITRLVCSELQGIAEWPTLTRPDQLGLLFAGLFHDAGKPTTSAPDPESGRIRSPKHARAGAEVARHALRDLGCELATREKVASLVRYHGLLASCP